jgi:hypothetical protein
MIVVDQAAAPARLTLAIAGLPIAIALPDPAWIPGLRERYVAFLADGAAAAWQVAVTHDPGLADEAAAWVRHDGPRTTFRLTEFEGWIDLAARQAAVSVPSEDRAASALERTLAYLLMQALPREHDSLLLHATAAVIAGRGHLFAGPSGAGKTTVARLAAGHADVLCDENAVVRLAAAGPELWSTPFWGMSSPPELVRRVAARVPLAAIYILTHAADFRLERLAPAQAALALLTTEKVTTERPESAAVWLAVADRLIAAVPVYRLGFRPTTELWDFLKGEVNRPLTPDSCLLTPVS